MTTHVEQLAAQIRQLSPLERQQLLNLVPDFGGTNAKPLSNTKLEFNGQNISVSAYELLPDDEKLKFLDNAEKDNAEWLKEKFKALHAAWMMVVDGEVAAFGESMDSYPNDEEFSQLCQKLGKYPFVFLNPLILAIEEPGGAWHSTVLATADFYPAISITIAGNWMNSPFVQINPNRSVLLGRGPLLDLRPKVELDFGSHATKVTY